MEQKTTTSRSLEQEVMEASRLTPIALALANAMVGAAQYSEAVERSGLSELDKTKALVALTNTFQRFTQSLITTVRESAGFPELEKLIKENSN